MKVYIAGPYTSDPASCTAEAIRAGGRILDAGHTPFVPHLAHYWETLHDSRPYEDWMRLDLAWLEVSEAVIRLPGASSGADREASRAAELDIPVFESVDQFLEETA